MQQYAVTNDVKGCDAWLLQRPQLKDYFIMNLFNLSKTNWARMKVQDSGIRVKIANKIRHITRRNRIVIERGGFVNKRHGLAREPWGKRNNGFVRIDSRHWSRVGLINKLRSTVRFAQDPQPLTHKRSSRLKIRVADYVGSIITTQKLSGHAGKSDTFQ